MNDVSHLTLKYTEAKNVLLTNPEWSYDFCAIWFIIIGIWQNKDVCLLNWSENI